MSFLKALLVKDLIVSLKALTNFLELTILILLKISCVFPYMNKIRKELKKLTFDQNVMYKATVLCYAILLIQTFVEKVHALAVL